jgi:hypothetical protein
MTCVQENKMSQNVTNDTSNHNDQMNGVKSKLIKFPELSATGVVNKCYLENHHKKCKQLSLKIIRRKHGTDSIQYKSTDRDR